jgi:hypothetical protein
MNRIEKQAAFYRGYLVDDRSLAPLTTALATIIGLWLLVYIMSAVGGPQPNALMVERVAHASSLASQSP